MDGGRVAVKGAVIQKPRDADPLCRAMPDAANGVDEIVLLHITATSGSLNPPDAVRRSVLRSVRSRLRRES